MCNGTAYRDLSPERRRLALCRSRIHWQGVAIPEAEYCTALSTEADEAMLAEIASRRGEMY